MFLLKLRVVEPKLHSATIFIGFLTHSFYPFYSSVHREYWELGNSGSSFQPCEQIFPPKKKKCTNPSKNIKKTNTTAAENQHKHMLSVYLVATGILTIDNLHRLCPYVKHKL